MWGYRAKAGDEMAAHALMEHIKMTLKIDPQWASQQMTTMRNAASQNMAALNQLQQQEGAMLKQQADASQAMLNARHQQSMQALQSTANRANAQAQYDADWHKNQMVNHYAQMAVKDNNNYHEVLMIQNKHLEWDPVLHGNVAVPNY
jgi:hypothetical protein